MSGKCSELTSEESTIRQYLSRSGSVPADDVIDCLNRISQGLDAQFFDAVASLCFARDREVHEKAMAIVPLMVPLLSADVLWNFPRTYWAVKDVVFELLKNEEISSSVLGVASLHSNGFVREAALRRLAQCFDGLELPFILVRANDWVPQIHQLASEAITLRLHRNDYAGHFVENLPLLERLWDAARYNQEQLQTAVENTLKQGDARTRLMKQFALSAVRSESGGMTIPRRESSRTVQRYSFKLLLDTGDAEKAINYGLQHPDLFIRSEAARRAMKLLNGQHLEALVPKLLKERVPVIRKDTLRWIAENKWGDFRQILTMAGFDRNGGIRQLARYFLKDVDFSVLYLDALTSNGRLVEIALKGLMEISYNINFDTLEPLLQSQKASVRYAAHAALFERTSQRGVNIAMQALADPSPRIVRLAGSYLSKNDFSLGSERIVMLLQSSDTPRQAKRALIGITFNLNKWDALFYLIEFTTALEPALQNDVHKALRRWVSSFNERFATPTDEQITRCKEALLQRTENVPPCCYSALEQLLWFRYG